MRAILAMTFVTLLVGIVPAQAQNYPWCAQRSDGARYCGYVSYEQCVANGARGSCERNFQYQGPAEGTQTGRGRRR